MATVLAIEPYAARSHQAWLDGLRTHSRHRIDALTMPARKWKWRMRGSAMHVAAEIAHRDPPDILVATDFLNLAELVGIGPAWLRRVPKLLYFHENQLTYPILDESERDYQYAFTHLTSALAADRIAFNSAYHRGAFLDALGALLRRMPDHQPTWAVEALTRKSAVLPLGYEPDAVAYRADGQTNGDRPLRILWNHRWEYDKDPDTFVAVLLDLAGQGARFEVSVLGETFRTAPPVFARARPLLGDRVVHWGFLPDRRDYVRALAEADVVVSTARHEFFGLAVVEAIAAGCYPLLPNRLTYPELLPPDLHERHLYRDPADLTTRLAWCAQHLGVVRTSDVASAVGRFAWDRVITLYDTLLDDLLSKE